MLYPEFVFSRKDLDVVRSVEFSKRNAGLTIFFYNFTF